MLYVKQLYKKMSTTVNSYSVKKTKFQKKQSYEHSGETKPEVAFFLAGGCVQQFGISPINLGRNCNFFFLFSQ